MGSLRVLVHIVTWNSARCIEQCLASVLAQNGFRFGKDLGIFVTDNASTDETAAVVKRIQSSQAAGVIQLRVNSENLGFCGAHNQGAMWCIAGAYDALLILNPDVALESSMIQRMCAVVERDARIGLVTPKLLRAQGDLRPVSPPIIDAAGMILTPAIRHFDRGSGEPDAPTFDNPQVIFGGTGACLLVTRRCIEDVSLSPQISNDAVYRIYPQLRVGQSERMMLFDEAFFAYREDADLSWRAGLRGWTCWYEPAARGYHVRVVTPERRSAVAPELNLYSVRNRFLLQFNNWSLREGIASLVMGLLLRNLIVLLGIVCVERSSLRALHDVCTLARRALLIRRENFSRRGDA